MSPSIILLFIQVILHLLGLTNKYDFAMLQQAIITYLKATLSGSNVCYVYNVASFYQLKDLCSACSAFVDLHALEVMKSEGFLSLSQSVLTDLVHRDSFFAPELDIYHGVVRWMKHNDVAHESAKEFLKGIRLQLIPLADLLEEVRVAGYFDADCILDAIQMANQTPDIKLGYRGLLSKPL